MSRPAAAPTRPRSPNARPAGAGATAPPLAGSGARLLAGVHADWAPLIDAALLERALAGIDAAGDAAATAPPPAAIFACLRACRPAEIRVVVVGEGPGAAAADASGLAFGAPAGRPVPAPLAAVFACLERAGYLKRRPAHGDLRPLAVQGVLLLDAALTTRAGAAGAHLELWRPFVAALLGRLAAAVPARFLLWGALAQALGGPPAEKHGREVLAWGHPAPARDALLPEAMRFARCDHFARLQGALAPPIHWAVDSAAIAFTDGSCPRNGAEGAAAGFGVAIIGGHLGPTTIRGAVAPFTFRLRDAADPERGFEPTAAPAAPTNNRAELLALCWAALALLRGRALGAVEIVSDSMISVRTFNEWLPARRAKGTAHLLANFDLVAVAEALLLGLRRQASGLALVHTRAAHDRPRPVLGGATPAREVCYWDGNDRADRLAGSAVESSVALEVVSPVAPVRRLGA